MVSASDPDLTIEHRIEGDGESVRVEGDIDLSNVEQFEAAILAAINRSPAQVRLDLNGVAYFGSEGVRALVAAHQAATRSDVTLIVSAASRIVRRVLEISRLDDLVAPEADPV